MDAKVEWMLESNGCRSQMDASKFRRILSLIESINLDSNLGEQDAEDEQKKNTERERDKDFTALNR